MGQDQATVKVSFDHLRELVAECLRSPIIRPEHITQVEEEPGQIQRYDLSVDGMHLGAVRIVRIDEYIQKLTIIPPPESATRGYSDEEKRLLQERGDAKTQPETVVAVSKRIVDERDTHAQLILRRHEAAIDAFRRQLQKVLNWLELEELDWQSSEVRKPERFPTSRHYVAGQRGRQMNAPFESVTKWFRKFVMEGQPLPMGVHHIRRRQLEDDLTVWELGKIGRIELSSDGGTRTDIVGVTKFKALPDGLAGSLAAAQVEEALEQFIDAFCAWLPEYLSRSAVNINMEAGIAQSVLPSPEQLDILSPNQASPNVPDLETKGWDAIFEWYYSHGLPILNISLARIAEATGKSYRAVQAHKGEYDAEHGTSTRKRRKNSA